MKNGLVLLDKPAGRTSFEALGPIKRALGTGKVGHAGTLDRFATGLLPVLTGKLTKLIRVFSDQEKHYVARVHFGIETETLDPEGEVTARGELPTEAALSRAVERFTGDVVQVPPTYSAVHVDGGRAYQRARNGEHVEIPSRTVSVSRLKVVQYEPPEAVLDIRCGSGTYVRSLARDLAYELGTVSHLVGLRRHAIGGFSVDNAVSPEDFHGERDVHPVEELVAHIDGVRTETVTRTAAERIANGAPLTSQDFVGGARGDFVVGDVVILLTPEGRVAGAAERQEDRFKYMFVAAGQS